ncbi:microtubule-actin cross-linking factor 1-like [Artemia franciscana]
MLECMKAILEETKALDQRLVALDGTTQALVDGAYKHGSNACHIADQAEAIRGRYVDLRQQLEERCAALQVVFEAAAELLEVLKSVTVDLSSLEQEFDSMEAPARMLPVVQTQLDQVADYLARLQQYHDHLEETRSASEKLTKQGRDIQSSTDQITNMEKHILKLEERSKARNDELERVLGKLESFYGLLDKVLINIEESSNEEVKFKAV